MIVARTLEALRRRRQRQRTLAWARRFRESADQCERDEPPANVDPIIHQAMIDSFRGKARELEEEAKRI